nr:hypothetical protein [Nanoarchaeota archaeon]
MSLEKNIDDHLLKSQYEKMHLLGVQGILQDSLSDFTQTYKGNLVQFAPVKKEPNREFLAGVCFESFVDVTIARGYGGGSSIMSYSLDHKKSLDVIKHIVKKSRMILYTATPDFMASMQESLQLEMRTYENALRISRAKKTKIGNVWDAIRYINFLTSYLNYSEEDAFKTAQDKFKLSLI